MFHSAQLRTSFYHDTTCYTCFLGIKLNSQPQPPPHFNSPSCCNRIPRISLIATIISIAHSYEFQPVALLATTTRRDGMGEYTAVLSEAQDSQNPVVKARNCCPHNLQDREMHRRKIGGRPATSEPLQMSYLPALPLALSYGIGELKRRGSGILGSNVPSSSRSRAIKMRSVSFKLAIWTQLSKGPWERER